MCRRQKCEQELFRSKSAEIGRSWHVVFKRHLQTDKGTFKGPIGPKIIQFLAERSSKDRIEYENLRNLSAAEENLKEANYDKAGTIKKMTEQGQWSGDIMYYCVSHFSPVSPHLMSVRAAPVSYLRCGARPGIYIRIIPSSLSRSMRGSQATNQRPSVAIFIIWRDDQW